MKPISRQILTTAVLASGLAPVGNAVAAPSSAGARTFTGSTVSMRWGPVQVKIKVKGRKIVNVLATAPIDRPRSAFVNGQALPLLKTEVLTAQSAHVSLVSGATMTSKAYLKSLQTAVVKAQL